MITCPAVTAWKHVRRTFPMGRTEPLRVYGDIFISKEEHTSLYPQKICDPTNVKIVPVIIDRILTKTCQRVDFGKLIAELRPHLWTVNLADEKKGLTVMASPSFIFFIFIRRVSSIIGLIILTGGWRKKKKKKRQWDSVTGVFWHSSMPKRKLYLPIFGGVSIYFSNCSFILFLVMF